MSLRATYTGYFERQAAGLCGKHALNNLLGKAAFTEEDLRMLCNHYILLKEWEDGLQDGEDASWHCGEGGWFSSELLAYALRHASFVLGPPHESFELVLDSADNVVDHLKDEDTIGALQNRDGAHWVAIKKEGDAMILLDSLAQPVSLGAASLHEVIAQWPHTYAVKRLYA